MGFLKKLKNGIVSCWLVVKECVNHSGQNVLQTKPKKTRVKVVEEEMEAHQKHNLSGLNTEHWKTVPCFFILVAMHMQTT